MKFKVGDKVFINILSRRILTIGTVMRVDKVLFQEIYNYTVKFTLQVNKRFPEGRRILDISGGSNTWLRKEEDLGIVDKCIKDDLVFYHD